MLGTALALFLCVVCGMLAEHFISRRERDEERARHEAEIEALRAARVRADSLDVSV